MSRICAGTNQISIQTWTLVWPHWSPAQFDVPKWHSPNAFALSFSFTVSLREDQPKWRAFNFRVAAYLTRKRHFSRAALYTQNNIEEEKPGARTGSLLLVLFSELRSIPHLRLYEDGPRRESLNVITSTHFTSHNIVDYYQKRKYEFVESNNNNKKREEKGPSFLDVFNWNWFNASLFLSVLHLSPFRLAYIYQQPGSGGRRKKIMHSSLWTTPGSSRNEVMLRKF